MPALTLLTDFGLRDGYVAAVKGRLLREAPEAQLVDLTHEIEPGDVLQAAFVLAQAAPEFPMGTVHLVVVDPGVGSSRRGLIATLGGAHYVAPDNGVLARVIASSPLEGLREIPRSRFEAGDVSPVFHGRDVFAPIAAALARGTAPAGLGTPLEAATLAPLDWPQPEHSVAGLVGRVLHVDRFGNWVTNLPALESPPAGRVRLSDGREIRRVRSYFEAQPGEVVALSGSHGLLELASFGAPVAASGLPRDAVIIFLPD